MKKSSKVLLRNLVAFILAAALSLGILTVPVFAEGIEETITVYIRIESGIPGNEHTVLPQTPVTITLDGEEATVLMALDAAMDSNIDYDDSEWGVFINSIGGISGEASNCYWMFKVNDIDPGVGAESANVIDGDEIVFYCIDWQEGVYSFFTPSQQIVNGGESFTLTLTGVDIMGEESPVAGAMINIVSMGDTFGILPLIAYFTNDEGQVEISLPSPGTYNISAVKHNEEGTPVISKPQAIITVLEVETETTETTETPETLEDVPALTTPPEPDILVFVIDEINYTINGMQRTSEIGAPFIDPAAGRTMVPLRLIAESLGYEVSWDPESATAFVNGTGVSIILVVGEDLPDGLGVPQISEGRTYVPLAYVLQQFGILYSWDEGTRSITITR